MCNEYKDLYEGLKAKVERQAKSPGRPCWYRSRYQKLDGTWMSREWRKGFLLTFGQDSEEARDGILIYPAAIVEDADSHETVIVPANCVNFGEGLPS